MKIAAPKILEPDLPREFEVRDAPGSRDDVIGVRFTGLSGSVDAAHARLAECVLEEASVDRLDLTGAGIGDVVFTTPRATELLGRDGTWRTVRVEGGRIGTLDLGNAELGGVELRGIRIDYLALGSARISDLLIADCSIGTLDLPLAVVSRMAFRDTRIDEIDTRGLRARDLDLRGAEVLSFTDPAALRGAALSYRQAELHSAAFATALGIRIED